MDIVIILATIVIAFVLGRLTGKSGSPNIMTVAEIPKQPIFSPQITVVFQHDIDDDDELYKEIADMYMENRAFYYSGTNPSSDVPLLPEKELDVFVRFNNIDFSKLQKIEV